jgi:hypothetical protein
MTALVSPSDLPSPGFTPQLSTTFDFRHFASQIHNPTYQEISAKPFQTPFPHPENVHNPPYTPHLRPPRPWLPNPSRARQLLRGMLGGRAIRRPWYTYRSCTEGFLRALRRFLTNDCAGCLVAAVEAPVGGYLSYQRKREGESVWVEVRWGQNRWDGGNALSGRNGMAGRTCWIVRRMDYLLEATV